MKVIGIHGSINSGKDTIADYCAKRPHIQKASFADPLKRLGLHVFDFSPKWLWGPSEYRSVHDSRYHTCEIRSSGAQFEWGQPIRFASTCDEAWLRAAQRLLTYGPIWLKDVVPERDVGEMMETLCFWFSSLGHKYPQLTPRIMLQSLGTGWGREVIDPDLWVTVFGRTVNKMLDGYLYQPDFGLLDKRTAPTTCVVCPDVRMSNELDYFKQHKKEGWLMRVERPGTQEAAKNNGIPNHSSEMKQEDVDYTMYDAVLNNKGTLDELYKSLDTILTCCGLD